MKILNIPLVAILLVVAGREFDANAQTETMLYSFSAFPTDGHYSHAGLVQGSDGNFYGTTLQGGDYGGGTVFQISPGGSEAALYFFGITPNDGTSPLAGLVQGSDGNFYGTTGSGGTSSNGTVFQISPSGTYSNLYSFAGAPTDGSGPVGGLVQGSDGNFYGTTVGGGTSSNCGFGGCGTIFRISPGGSETNLYNFGSSPTDGESPSAGLVQGSDGNFYGTTGYGGQTNNGGTVFRISPSGSYTNLYSFHSNPTDGSAPRAGLIEGSDGNLYGTTYFGGTNSAGTVFRISPSGSYTNLYSFIGSPTDGQYPSAGLVQGSDGNFYGTTGNGGGHGTVFRISPSGSYTNLYFFAGPPNDGTQPLGGLVQGSDGNFYGTTVDGGNGYGTVFGLSFPLSSPPNQITAIQKSGTNLVIAIPSIAGETYQLQFSSSMKPTNWVNVAGASVTNCVGALLTVTNFGGAIGPQGFYRFDVTP